MKNKNQAGFSGWFFLVIILVLAGAGGYFYFLNQKKGIQSIESLQTLEVVDVELGEMLPEEGLEIQATLSATNCPSEEIYASLLRTGETNALLSFQCLPKGRKKDLDPGSIRKVRYLWSPRPSELRNTEATIQEEHTLNVQPIGKTAIQKSVRLSLEARFQEKKKGLYTPEVKYQNPKLDINLGKEDPNQNGHTSKMPRFSGSSPAEI